jgi:hypothetical protein
MGTELGSIYTRLWNDCAWLFWKWDDFVVLYGTSPERLELLNSAAPAFFYQLQGMMWDSILLHICRLTDPAKQFRKENLTLQRLLDFIDVAIRADVERLLASAREKCAFARDWRNRRITHTDLGLALKQNAGPLTSGSRKDVRASLDSIAAVLNRVELHYCGAEVGYHHFQSRLSARALVYILELGLKSDLHGV